MSKRIFHSMTSFYENGYVNLYGLDLTVVEFIEFLKVFRKHDAIVKIINIINNPQLECVDIDMIRKYLPYVEKLIR